MNSTTTPHKARRERRSTLFPLSRNQLLPLGLNLPKPIVDANQVATDAYETFKAEQRKARDVDAQAKHAPRHDELAKQAAVAAGEKPPAETAGKKRAAAEEAGRVAQARELHAKNLVRSLYDAIEDNYDDYLEALRKPAEEAKLPVGEIIAGIVDRLAAGRDATALHRNACEFHNNPASASLSHGVGSKDNLARRYERALDQQRSQVRPNNDVRYELADLLAGLTRILEDEIDGPREPGPTVIRSGELAATKR